MKYKVLKDYPTTDGVLYENEIVKVWDSKTIDGNLRVKDNMGRIWFLNSEKLTDSPVALSRGETK